METGEVDCIVGEGAEGSDFDVHDFCSDFWVEAFDLLFDVEDEGQFFCLILRLFVFVSLIDGCFL